MTQQGNKNDSGKPPITWVPYTFVRMVAEVFLHGSEEYGKDNWAKGISYSRLADGVLRHLGKFMSGSDYDKKSNRHHLAHAGCGVCMLLMMTIIHPEMDDRPEWNELLPDWAVDNEK